MPRDPAHEADGHEHGHNCERDRDHSEPDLVGRFEGRAIGRFAHAHMTHDVLDLHNRVVDKDTGDECDGKQRHHVQRKAERVHRPEGREDRKRQRNRGDDRRAQIAKEKQHDEHREHRALDQRVHGRAVVPQREVDGGVDFVEMHARVRVRQFANNRGHAIRHARIAFALGPHHGESHHVAPIELGKGPAFLSGIGYLAQLIEAHFAPARQRDRGGCEPLHGRRACKGTDGLFGAANFAPAAGEIGIRRAELLVHLARRDAEREQPVGIERDPDFALQAADAGHLRHPSHALELARDCVVDEPGKLFQRHGWSGRRVDDDGQSFHIETLNDRLFDGARKLLADLGHGVLHIVDSAVGIRAQLKLDGRYRRAIGDRRADMLDVGHTRDGIFHALRDLGFQLDRSRARLRDADRDNRDVDVRKARDREVLEAHRAQHDEHEEQHKRGYRTPDRPGGNVRAAHAISAREQLSWPGLTRPSRLSLKCLAFVMDGRIKCGHNSGMLLRSRIICSARLAVRPQPSACWQIADR